MSLEDIRKIWVLLGTLVAALSLPWIPGWLDGLLSVEGTEFVFQAIGAVIALWQFVKSRTGEDTPQALKTSQDSKVAYLLNPFKAA